MDKFLSGREAKKYSCVAVVAVKKSGRKEEKARKVWLWTVVLFCHVSQGYRLISNRIRISLKMLSIPLLPKVAEGQVSYMTGKTIGEVFQFIVDPITFHSLQYRSCIIAFFIETGSLTLMLKKISEADIEYKPFLPLVNYAISPEIFVGQLFQRPILQVIL